MRPCVVELERKIDLHAMNPFKLSAQFVAYVWFTQRKEGAFHEARDNWIAFLPYADKNLDMLLIEIAKPCSKVVRRPLARGPVWGSKTKGLKGKQHAFEVSDT